MTIIFTAKPHIKIELKCEEKDWNDADEYSKELFIKEDLIEYLNDVIIDIIRSGKIKILK